MNEKQAVTLQKALEISDRRRRSFCEVNGFIDPGLEVLYDALLTQEELRRQIQIPLEKAQREADVIDLKIKVVVDTINELRSVYENRNKQSVAENLKKDLDELQDMLPKVAAKRKSKP